MMAIAFAAIFFKFASPTHPLVSAGWRLAIASAVLMPWLVRALTQKRFPRETFMAAGLGGFFYAMHFGAWVWSLELTSVAASVTLVTATPLLLAVWGTLSGRDVPTPQLWRAIAVSSLGILLISGGEVGQSMQAWIGNGLALLGAAAMAGYMITVRKLGRIDVFAFGAVTTAVAAILLFCSAGALGVSLLPASTDAAFFILLAALIPQLIGHSVITWVLRLTSPTVVGLATLIEPVGSTTLAWVLLNEVPAPLVVGGCLLTLVGVGLAILGRGPSREGQPSTSPGHE